jgi:hypothetical protein
MDRLGYKEIHEIRCEYGKNTVYLGRLSIRYTKIREDTEIRRIHCQDTVKIRIKIRVFRHTLKYGWNTLEIHRRRIFGLKLKLGRKIHIRYTSKYTKIHTQIHSTAEIHTNTAEIHKNTAENTVKIQAYFKIRKDTERYARNTDASKNCLLYSWRPEKYREIRRDTERYGSRYSVPVRYGKIR